MNRQFERYLQMTLIIMDLLLLNSILFITQYALAKTIHEDTTGSYFNYWVIANV